MEDEAIAATPAPDVAIILTDEKRVRVLVNSAVLRQSSQKFDDLLRSTVNSGNLRESTETLPELIFPGVYLNEAAAALLRFLHHDYDVNERLDCPDVLGIATLAEDYDVLHCVGLHLENLISLKTEIFYDAGDLSFLLLAASTMQSTNKFREVSSKMIRCSLNVSFEVRFYECLGDRDFEPEICNMLEAARLQINDKLSERLSPVLDATRRCDCTDKSGMIEYMRGEVEDCLDTNDRRTLEERLELLKLVRSELEKLKHSSFDPQLQGSCNDCVLQHAIKCLGCVIQDIRNICYEGLSLAEVVEEQARNAHAKTRQAGSN